MARINLLPWREELRRQRQRHFLSGLLITAVLGVVLVFLVMVVYNQNISHQNYRNDLITAEIRKLESLIQRIEELERTRENLISRKQVIETLQASRSMTVELLDQLAKTIPVGVTLETVRQQGPILSLTGSSQSNARVSAYLRELEGNELFLNPQLDFVRSVSQPETATEPYEFSIKVNMRPPASAAESEGYDDAGNLGGSE
jgi:type IV pilus assembly protein PilN